MRITLQDGSSFPASLREIAAGKAALDHDVPSVHLTHKPLGDRHRESSRRVCPSGPAAGHPLRVIDLDRRHDGSKNLAAVPDQRLRGVVTLRGVLAIGRDIGGGYAYDAIVENARIVK